MLNQPLRYPQHVRRLGLLALWAAAMFAGRQLSGAAHELGHAAIALALCGRVDAISLWAILAPPITEVSGLSTASRAIVVISGVLTTAAISVAVLFLIPWRKLPDWLSSTAAAFTVYFIMGLAAFAYYVFSTGNNDAANFIKHSGGNPYVVFLLAGVGFIALLLQFLSRTNVVECASAAYSTLAADTRLPASGGALLMGLLFVVLSWQMAGRSSPYHKVPVGVAVLLDGVALQNTSAKADIRDGRAEVLYEGSWYTASFSTLEPGGSVALYYNSSFTNCGGAALPKEIYSPEKVRISATGYSPHHYAAEINGKNPRVSAQWTNRLSEVLAAPEASRAGRSGSTGNSPPNG